MVNTLCELWSYIAFFKLICLATCKITIDSSTTSAEVVKVLCKGLGINQDHVVFALFEKSGPSNERSIEDRQIVADVLAKFERYFENLVLLLGWKTAFPAGVHLFEVSNGNTKNSVLNLFKVKNKDTKTTSMTSFCCLYC